MQVGKPQHAVTFVTHPAMLPIFRRKQQVRINLEEKSQMTALVFRKIQIKALCHNLTKIIPGR